MSRRRIQKPRRKETADKPAAPFHSPFRGLAGRVRVTPAEKPARRSSEGANGTSPHSAGAPRPHPAERSDEHEIFLSAVADVQPLVAEPRVAAPPPSFLLVKAPVSEEAEALARLSDLVSGAGEFDVSDSTEYIEGAVVGLDRRILRRLRRGEFAYQAAIDLHGMSAAAARAAVEAFIKGAVLVGHRCVLIVHGRGHNSKDNVPVLKARLMSWLSHGRIGRVVLAFTSARPADGGAGAVYVLLRRRRGAKEPITVYEGAKRE
jgi:DNA-nicking Smr family endonuclease